MKKEICFGDGMKPVKITHMHIDFFRDSRFHITYEIGTTVKNFSISVEEAERIGFINPNVLIKHLK